MLRNAAIYTRVSTTKQEDGTSLETQLAACLNLATELGCTVDNAHIWQEVASGADIINRRGFKEMRDLIDIGVFTDVFVHATDRASRDPIDLLNFCRQCSRAGVRLHFIVGPQGNDDYADLIRFVSGFAGKQERAMIAERTARGKIAVARSGRLPNGTGAGLYGYDYDRATKTRTINEAQANVVRRIFKMTAAGRSAWNIALKLNEEGIPTMRGKKWCSIAVSRTLQHTAYYGLNYYGQTRSLIDEFGRRQVEERPKEEWIEITGFTPPIISEALFEAAKERRGNPIALRSTKQSYLLTGFTSCGTCGTSITGASRMGKTRQYRCRATYKTSVSGATCHESYFNADEMEAIVWAEVTRALTGCGRMGCRAA